MSELAYFNRTTACRWKSVVRDPASVAPPALTRMLGWCFRLLVLGFVVYAAHTVLGLGGHGADTFFNDGLYNAIMLGSALVMLARALSARRHRLALILIGAALLTWALGDLYYTIFFSALKNPPFPSFDDALYLSFYPVCYLGLGLLARARFREASHVLWLDGVIAGLGLGAIAVAWVLGPILSATGGNLAAVATNLAYPVGDLLLILVALGVAGASGWRPGWTWTLITLSLIATAGADMIYLYQVATNAYVEGAWSEALWPLSSLLLVYALSLRSPRRSEPLRSGWRAIAVPTTGGLAALGVLFVDHGTTRVNDPARYLALATVLVAVARIVLTFRGSQLRERRSRVEAITDPLTGLGNRRMLTEDLGETIALATKADPRLVVLYDLNGFKHYNDSFGHPAGDTLLVRLGQNLGATVAAYGRAYRMGGDEFCVLLRPGNTPIEALVASTTAALAESGDGFEIDAANGVVLIPFEVSTASDALQLADRRLYMAKDSRPSGVTRQLRSVLLRVLDERQSSLHQHLEGVAALAFAVGRRMGLDPEALDVVVRAAELHDIGKTAIPDSILNKPGPLDAEEWSFMRRHTVLGERILSAAPALIPVSTLVRSSHERWDGNGYPDRIAGEDIPLGSRIIFACDAYDAMTTARVYSPAKTKEQALAELSRCSGTDFDPRVVESLIGVITPDTHPAVERLGDLPSEILGAQFEPLK
jgi:diguanylate cyclase (GGDEF)-like protein